MFFTPPEPRGDSQLQAGVQQQQQNAPNSSSTRAAYLQAVAYGTGTATLPENPPTQAASKVHQFSNSLYGASDERQSQYWGAAGAGVARAVVDGDAPWADALGKSETEALDEEPTIEGARIAPVNEATAAVLYKQAADQNDAEAQYSLGTSYFTGTGVRKDQVRAVQYYKLAADSGGHAGAQNALGFCHRFGVGAVRNLEVAARYYRFAAEQDHPEAAFSLGGCYRDGIGVAADSATAEKWTRRAAKLGHAEAQSVVQRYYSAATPDLATPWARTADQEATHARVELEKAIFPQVQRPRNLPDWDPSQLAPRSGSAANFRAGGRFNLCQDVALSGVVRPDNPDGILRRGDQVLLSDVSHHTQRSLLHDTLR